ncbi:MAG: TetR/AcrR family transcriptional regulator [Deltaproteobacteria bacterium]|nr:TetR/AcrR family transcriptional regulator [Deltaproteobacteria bacterium]MDH3896545.1 TetR/AcrR family transcriptional regulator [Deltaproteobacteria bacterium]
MFSKYRGMGIKERKKRDAGKMRSRILKAAMELYVKGGYENVTMRRIAAKIEYSPGTIYLYFQNKKDIMLQLCYQGFERLLAQQDKLVKIADPLEKLSAGGRYYLAFALENPELYELMFATKEILKESGPDEESVPLRAFRKFAENVKACLDAGIFSAGEVETTAIALWATLHGLASLLIKGRLRFLPEESLGKVVEQAYAFSLRKRGE